MTLSTISTIDEMFRWRLDKDQCEKENVEHIIHLSVEETNSENAKNLKWTEYTDVLYSFLLTYKLGLEIISEDDFCRCAKEYKNYRDLRRLNTNSPQFLYFCSNDKAFMDLNNCQEYKDFLGLYFTIGNLIPTWPGGNEARGKMGLYDIPEIFFRKYNTWTKALLKQYPNANMDRIINSETFLVCRKNADSFRIKGYRNAFNNILQLKQMMKNNKDLYFDYLKHRNDVIRQRQKALNNILEIE